MVSRDRQTTVSIILTASFPLLLFAYAMWAIDINYALLNWLGCIIFNKELKIGPVKPISESGVQHRR